MIHATEALAPFAAAGVLAAADVHVAQRLGRLGLGRPAAESDGAVLLAAALAVRALRFGSVCVDLARVATSVAPVGAGPAGGLPAGGSGILGDHAVPGPPLPWPEPAAWVAAVRASPLVTLGPADTPLDQVRPLRFVDGLLYLERYWRQQQVVARWVDAAVAGPVGAAVAPLEAALDRLFPDASADPLQRRAAEQAATHRFSVVAGGPGTGKTWTVARILAVLQSQAGGRLRVALAAPTGKAAARLAQSIAENVDPPDAATAPSSDNAPSATAPSTTQPSATAPSSTQPPATQRSSTTIPPFPVEDRQHVEGLTATTLHRLLGARPGSNRYTFDRTNRLPHDLVVVDEASMVSLTLMSRLMDALRPDCRLVLVGDPDQLASIEVGAVLGDLVARPGTPVVRLEIPHRFSDTTDISALAAAIRSGEPGAVEAALNGRGVEFVPVDAATAGPARLAGLRDDVVTAGRRVVTAARAGDASSALEALAGHQVLCAHREGGYGVRRWGAQAESWLRIAVEGYGREGSWYVGRPLLITQNDHQLRLYNGDVGVVVAAGGRSGVGRADVGVAAARRADVGRSGVGRADAGRADAGRADVTGGGVRAAFTREGAVHLEIPGRLGPVDTVHALSIHRSQGSQYDRVTVILPPAASPLMTRELLYTAVTRARNQVRIIGTPAALAAAVRRPIIRASGLRVPVPVPGPGPVPDPVPDPGPVPAPGTTVTSAEHGQDGHR